VQGDWDAEHPKGKKQWSFHPKGGKVYKGQLENNWTTVKSFNPKGGRIPNDNLAIKKVSELGVRNGIGKEKRLQKKGGKIIREEKETIQLSEGVNGQLRGEEKRRR